jgi:signal peptidase I
MSSDEAETNEKAAPAVAETKPPAPAKSPMEAATAPTAPSAAAAAAATPPVQRNKLIAAVFSILAPGLGQVFVGHTLRGIAWAIVAPLFFLFFLFASTEPSPTSLLKTFIALILAAYLGSAIDVILLPAAKHRPVHPATVVLFALGAFFAAPVISMVLRALVIEAFKIPSGAMIPTVRVGDHLFVDKAIYRRRAPRRGDVIVFKYPEHPEQDFVKRAIGRPGDSLLVRGGHPIINGWEVPSCRVGKFRYEDVLDPSTRHEGDVFVEFLEESAYLILLESGTPAAELGADLFGPFTVKDNEYFVLGDNRHNSHDSRMWFGGEGGGVPRDSIKGRARTIWLGTEQGRAGIDVGGDPVAPTADLAGPLATCLSKRPSVKDATPPAKAP